MAVWQLRLGRGIALLSFVPVAAVCPSMNSMQTGAAKKQIYTLTHCQRRCRLKRTELKLEATVTH